MNFDRPRVSRAENKNRAAAYTLVLLSLLIFASPARAAGPLRARLNINREWKFELGDHPGAQAVAYDDSNGNPSACRIRSARLIFKARIFTPATAGIAKALTFPPHGPASGCFWNSTARFRTPRSSSTAGRSGTIWADTPGFSFDITSAAHPAEILAVRLNNNWNPRLAPRAGDYLFAGGIYRDVWLVVTDPLHVTWYGTFVTTPAISKDAATVDVKTEVQNQGRRSPRTCCCRPNILDPDGNSVARLSSTQTIAAGATLTIDQTSPPIPNPRLWNPDHPLLYRAVTTLSDGNTPVDDYQTTFGMRWIKWTADQGFFINGQHLYFHGADVHQDHAGWANAVTQAGVFAM
jgi:beta-galactosidase